MEITDDVVQDFLDDCPGFDDSSIWSEHTIKRALGKADRETGGSCWGPYGDLTVKQEGMFAFAAHWLMIKKGIDSTAGSGGIAAAVGAVQSKTVGDESVSFAISAPTGGANQSGEALLSSTTPGQEFIRLRNQVSTGVTVH